MPISVICSRHGQCFDECNRLALPLLRSLTGDLSASTTQIEVVLSETSCPTTTAHFAPPLLERSSPRPRQRRRESDYPSSRKRLRVRVLSGFAVTGCRLRERLAAPVAEIRDVKTPLSGGYRSEPGEPL